MRRLPLVLGFFVTLPCNAAVVYDFTPVAQQISGMVQATPDMYGASLIVLRNGAVIYQGYFGTFTPATRVPVASASKWLSALTIERLVEQGQMHWTDTVGQYIPGAPVDKQAITLGQLFSHTSGLTKTDDPCLGDYQNYTLASCAEQILATPLAYPPGTAFAYTGNGMQIGGRMAEVATGQDWAALFQNELTSPLGMADTRFSGDGVNPRIAGGVASTMADYAKVVQMVVQQGQWNGAAFLSAAGVAAMQQDQTHGAPIIGPVDPFTTGYGYGEWRDVVDAQGRAVQVSSTGAFGTSPWINNQTGVAAVFLTLSQDLAKANIRALWENVNAVVIDPVFSDGFDP